jgi:hypothetical protein
MSATEMRGTGTTRKIFVQNEIKIADKFSMIFFELYYKSYESKKNAEELTKKGDIRPLNQSKNEYLRICLDSMRRNS